MGKQHSLLKSKLPPRKSPYDSLHMRDGIDKTWSNHRTIEGDENTEGTAVSGLSEFNGSAIQWADRGRLGA
jgi:hypothetical protein